MIQPAPAAQRPLASLSAQAWQQTFDAQAAQGYGPVILAATGPASSPLFAAVFEPQNPIPLTRHGLSSGPDPWNSQQINNSGVTAGPSASGNLFVCVYNDQQHFSYIDGNGNIQDAWYGSNGWHLQEAGAQMSAAGNSRAGFGFDFVNNLGGGQFYAQKGGLMGSNATVMQFNGDWGFTMLWGSDEPGSPDVMNIATRTNWGSGDLFPQFGMPSL